jgi:hypothetical protein
MANAWHCAAALRRIATALLALALAAIAATYAANQKSVAIQGPGALQAIDGRTVCLGVDEELWVLDRDGHRTARRTAQSLGFTEAVSNIVLAPGGQALLTSRGDLAWQVVDRATLARVRTITPQWPPDFADNYLRAIHLAIAPDGDIAVATGGGHAVLLFDREGRLKGRTAPDTYHFTNGLWWSREGWWTTDTNRLALRLLDARTLAVRRSVDLRPEPARTPWLGEAIASQGAPRPGGTEAPFATVSRLGTLMEPGHAVDVFADGTHVLFNRQTIPQLRDMAWFDGQLLLVDGDAFEVKRFGADRGARPPFGDAQVRSELARLRADRTFWRTLGSRYAFLLAAVLLLAGIAVYARHRRLAALEVVAARAGGRTVAPPQQASRLARERVRIFGLPVALRLAVAALSLFVLFPLLHDALLGPRPDRLADSLRLLLLCVAVPLVPIAFWQQWRHERLMRERSLEATLNHRAMQWLRLHADFDRVREDGEVARETVYLPGLRPRWLLVTNRRVLLFAASARERRLLAAWPRTAVVFAGEDLPGAGPRPLWRRLLLGSTNLALVFTDGTSLRLRCASTVTAQRVAGLLRTGIGAAQPVPSQAARLRRRWHEVLASLLVPGTGQWLQGRFVTGTVFFTAGLLLTLFDWGPVAWALHGPKMDVSALTVASVALTWVLLALVAAGEAWPFSAAVKRR